MSNPGFLSIARAAKKALQNDPEKAKKMENLLKTVSEEYFDDEY